MCDGDFRLVPVSGIDCWSHYGIAGRSHYKNGRQVYETDFTDPFAAPGCFGNCGVGHSAF